RCHHGGERLSRGGVVLSRGRCGEHAFVGPRIRRCDCVCVGGGWDHLDRVAAKKNKFMRRYYMIACVIAALMPFVSARFETPANRAAITTFPGWPSTFAGKT